MKVQPVIASPEEVLIQFLPSKHRHVRPAGVTLWGLRYWHEDIGDLVGLDQKHEVRYDPRDITCIYMRTSAGVLRKIPIVTPNVDRMSLWEWNRSRRLSREMGNSAASSALIDAGLTKSDSVVLRANKATRSARKRAAIENERLKPEISRQNDNSVEEKAKEQQSTIDMSRPIEELHVEIWD